MKPAILFYYHAALLSTMFYHVIT